MNDREIVLWLDTRWYEALSKQLKDETVEDRPNDYLDEMLNQLPARVYERISSEIWEETQKLQEQREAEQTLAAFCVTQDGKTEYFEVDRPVEFLDAAIRLRSYLRGQSGQSFASACGERTSLSKEQFEGRVQERMQNTGRVTGAFMIDLDRDTMCALNISDGWHTFKIRDVSMAAYHAMRKECLDWDKRFRKFIDRLDGKEITEVAGEAALVDEELSGIDEMRMD